MWGSTERAIHLEESDNLAVLLFQVTGPAHIPWKDQRWQELLHGYDVWVHVEQRKGGPVERAGEALAQHAPRSSNLAAFAMHVTRMVDAVLPTASEGTDAFSDRIALVGRARATAGALNLFRILMHAVIAHQPSDSKDYLSQCFCYKNRDSNMEQNTAPDILSALLRFLTRCSSAMKEIPEVYDTTALVLNLLLVAFSTQLYRPMISSFQRTNGGSDLFWTLLMQQARLHYTLPPSEASWVPRELLSCLMQWQIDRSVAPPRSIQEHNSKLAKQVAAAKGEKCGPDGMYETHLIVTASSQSNSRIDESASIKSASRALTRYQSRSSANVLIDATKGALVLSSTIILLPFRLVTLALGLLRRGDRGYDQMHKSQLQSSFSRSSRTNDVLWLTESPVADLASSFLLLILNNERAGSNAFRDEFVSLSDNRWEVDTGNGGLPDLPNLGDEVTPLVTEGAPSSAAVIHDENAFLVNFEQLFNSFGMTAHNEVGALLLYTVLQASPKFSEAIAVRSDLDTVVLPLLRTLYFSSSTRFYTSQASRGKGSGASKKLSIRNCPFRSQSQLYVMIILLLLFSQDTSFGADAFRRISIQSVPWYKERNLKTISLGSIVVLSMLRSLTFNLNRLQDPFLLSNCCAVLLNLAPSIVELHDYAAMRLSAVTVACIKRYAELVLENPKDDEEDLSTPRAMHGEVSRTLLQVIKHCVSSKNIDHNLHLIYALVYHQGDFKRVLASNDCPFRKSEYSLIQKVINAAKKIIDEGNDARTAPKALKVLLENADTLKQVATESQKRSSTEDLFTYEEESDPEVFFVPYVWEIIVSVVTSSTIEWETDKIQVFPLLDEPLEELPEGLVDTFQQDSTKFTTDVSDVV